MPSISSSIILSLMQMTSAQSLLYVSQIVTAISIANMWDPVIQTNLLCFHLTEQCAGYIHHPSCHSGFANTVFQFCVVLRAVIFSLNMVQRDEHHTMHYLSNHWNNKQRKQNLWCHWVLWKLMEKKKQITFVATYSWAHLLHWDCVLGPAFCNVPFFLSYR